MKHDYTKYDEADKRVKTFITAFYAASDDPAKNEEWVAFFTPEAVVVMGDKTAKGVEGTCVTSNWR
ncbi:hypothetical protein RRF57_012395 [Xylaria bambusicola]|uniref:Uncharacterized protein n=1 Tax=Xylaria bambusicola TaxID=326684 RepID=A0AAN7ZEN7_9PEZI